MNTATLNTESITDGCAKVCTSKVCALRKLDTKAKLPATIFTYTFGIVGSLLLWVGMCLGMGVIGGGTTIMFVLGIVIGIVGIIVVALNYPIYKKLLKMSKEKYGSTILELAKQIAEEK